MSNRRGRVVGAAVIGSSSPACSGWRDIRRWACASVASIVSPNASVRSSESRAPRHRVRGGDGCSTAPDSAAAETSWRSPAPTVAASWIGESSSHPATNTPTAAAANSRCERRHPSSRRPQRRTDAQRSRRRPITERRDHGTLASDDRPTACCREHSTYSDSALRRGARHRRGPRAALAPVGRRSVRLRTEPHAEVIGSVGLPAAPDTLEPQVHRCYRAPLTGTSGRGQED